MSDYISRQAEQTDRRYIEQIKWERDLAIRQLADLGYGLGEKPRTNGDLISRQAAIDTVFGRSHDIIRQRLKNLPSAQQWIPCSERPPEEDFWSGRGRQFSDHVFVTIVNHANDDEHFTDIAQTVDGIWRLSHDVDGDCSLPNWCEVIAWMPLPEPYKP